jgi:hypothetical protein
VPKQWNFGSPGDKRTFETPWHSIRRLQISSQQFQGWPTRVRQKLGGSLKLPHIWLGCERACSLRHDEHVDDANGPAFSNACRLRLESDKRVRLLLQIPPCPRSDCAASGPSVEPPAISGHRPALCLSPRYSLSGDRLERCDNIRRHGQLSCKCCALRLRCTSRIVYLFSGARSVSRAVKRCSTEDDISSTLVKYSTRAYLDHLVGLDVQYRICAS